MGLSSDVRGEEVTIGNFCTREERVHFQPDESDGVDVMVSPAGDEVGGRGVDVWTAETG